ncbi:MAG TPA: methyltransferase domain-containing protein [Anaerolineales bacterium]|nr:methyltransferase domain-containing protein [Anaerolineales bacterium]
MAAHTPYPEHLRSTYDRELLDVGLREKNASRLYRAFMLAGLWQANIRLLDVGSGTGILFSALGNDVNLRVACDLRRNIFAPTRQQLKNVLFAQCDGCALPFPDGHFELVTCLAVIEEITNWQAALAEMGRCVAPGGMLYVTIVNGKLLLKIYSIGETLGFRIREDWWLYAHNAQTNFNTPRPDEGLGILNMSEWRFIDVTPYLLQSQWTWTRLIPMPLLARLTQRIAPSYGYAWQKRKSSGNAKTGENRLCAA